MRNGLIFLLVVFTILQTYSKSNWEWLNPKPMGNSYSDVFFIDENNGWISAYSGTILKTKDAGENWKSTLLMPSKYFLSVFFINKDIGWVVGDSGTIMQTTNSGIDWNLQIKFTNETLGKIRFIDDKNGFIKGEKNLFYTSDGGLNWSSILKSPYIINNFHFIDSNRGWVIYKDKLLKTTDNGNSWNTSFLIDSVDFYSVHFIDEKNGWIGGDPRAVFFYKACIYKTSDGGLTWIEQLKDYKSSYRIENIFLKDSNFGWATGLGDVYFTSNGGLNWNQQFSSSFYGVHTKFLNSNNGLIVTGGAWKQPWGNIYKTTNGGKDWLLKSPNNFNGDDLNDVFFVDKNEGWVVGYGWLEGEHSSIYHTTDGGKNWDWKSLDLDNHIFSKVQFVDKIIGWIKDEGGSIYMTKNKGENWDYSNSGDCKDFHFIDKDNGFSIEYDGTFKITTDGGESWNLLKQYVCSSPEKIYFYDKNNGWILTNLYVYFTTDGGKNWESRYLKLKQGYLTNLYFKDINNGWVCNIMGGIYKTTDGGRNWDFIPSNASGNKIYFGDDNNGWIAGKYLWHTTDGGQNWEIQHYGCTSIFFNDVNNGWSVGLSGQLCKYSEEITGIEYKDESPLDNFFISPNPASDYIIINVGAGSKPALIDEIEIFNIFGEKTTPSNLSGLTPLIAKDGIIKIDISNLPAGVYFIRIGDKFEKFVKI